MLREAHGLYQAEVINQQKLYDRFAEDFLNGHKHPTGFTTQNKNRHSRNYGIMKGLLLNRPELVQQFFRPRILDSGSIENLLQLFNTTSPPTALKRPADETPKVRTASAASPATSFCCNFSQETINLITQCANEVRLFKEEVASADIAGLFTCRLEHPLTARNIRQLALFFHYMAEKDLIVNCWQKVVDTNRLILCPNGESVLTQRTMSSSLYQALEKPSNVRSILIHDWVKHIAESVSKERKSTK